MLKSVLFCYQLAVTHHVGIFMGQGFQKSKLASNSLHMQDDLELLILLCLPSKYWSYRHVILPYQGCTVLVIELYQLSHIPEGQLSGQHLLQYL